MHELAALVKYKRTNLFSFTETWLTEDTTDIDLEGYSLIRYDRDTTQTAKSNGGGLCLFVNSSWTTNITARETVCSTHYEILTASFRPHYLPREFGQITLMLVYIPGPDFTLAAERIAVSYNNALRHSADDPVFLL